jgi:phenylalanyl-tRNA synthetase beta chain
MRVPLEWLRSFCSPDLPAAAVADRLNMTGTEVKGVDHHGVGALERFVVGKVLTAEQHPNADRLRLCTVDVGEAEPAQIVCGAPNVAAGQTVPVARPGAVMPDGTKLKAAKLRGVESQGMILAEDELAIGTDHAGIIVLPDVGLAAGTPLEEVLPLATEVLDVEITPNRPDCLGIYGIARELHAATGAPLAPPPWDDDPGTVEGELPIEIVVEAPDLCPRFTARVFEDVRIGPSPPWLKARLAAAGQRPISNVVDITNYVMLLTGQPLHAFDLDRVEGARLVVRRAADGERLRTLDGQDRVLTTDDCLIADAAGPTSISGVMGGERSEVHDGTTRVLMEVANWNGPAIHATSTKLGLRSEASTRYEKGLAPEQTLDAQAVAAALMVEVCGARLLPGTVDVGGPGPEPITLRLRERRVEALLGVTVPRQEQADELSALGFDVESAPDGLAVTVPYWRREDVTREADLVEEVARLHGVNENLPATLPARRGAVGVLTPEQRLRRRAEDVLVGRGLHEIQGWSFEDPTVDDRLRLGSDDLRRRRVRLENPMSEDQSVLRTTLLGSLLDNARRNVSRGNADVALFESGPVYLDVGEQLPAEHRALGAVVVGSLDPRGWSGARDGSTPRVFLAKALVEAVLGTLRVDADVVAATEPFLHPGRAGHVRVDGEAIGWFGEVHPLVAQAWDLQDAVALELDLDKVIAAADDVPSYRDVTSFPELRQDLAVVVDRDVPAARVLEVVRTAGGDLLARADVFDVYTGPPVPDGRVSLALALAFRASDRTLTDEDVAPVRERVVAALRDELGGELRG